MRIKTLIFCGLMVLVRINLIAQEIQLAVQTGHSGPVNHLEFSVDSEILASAGADNNVVLWDVSGGKQMAILSGHTQEIFSIDFHPEEKLLASAGKDGTCRIWTYPEGREIKKFSFSEPVGDVEFSSDGRNLFIGTRELHVVELADYTETILSGSASDELITSVAVSHDSKLVAIGGEKRSTEIFDVEQSMPVSRHYQKAHDLAFDSLGHFIYGGSPFGKIFRKPVSDSGGQMMITANRLWKDYYAVAVSEDFFAGANKDGLVTVFGFEDSKIKYNLKGHDGEVKALAIGQNGKLLASAGEDKKILLWDLTNGYIAQSLQGIGSRINTIRFTGDGEQIVIGYDDGGFRLCSLYPGGTIAYGQVLSTGINRFLENFLPWNYAIDSIRDITSDEVVFHASRKRRNFKTDQYKNRQALDVFWNTETHAVRVETQRKMKRSFAFKPTYDPTAMSPLNGMKATIEGKTLVISDGDKVKHSIETGHTDMITSVAFNPKYPLVATGSWDGTVRVWDVENGQEIVAFSSFGKNDYIYINPENYYYASKGALDGIGFLYKQKILSFDQFDLIYNRPDIVFEHFPYIDHSLIENYRYAYHKRLEKLDLEEKDLTLSENIPQLTYHTDNASVSTSNETLNIHLEAKDEKVPLDRFFLEINGVPEISKDGLDISGAGHHWKSRIPVKLSAGLNDIQLYVINEKGAASLKESFQITYNERGDDPELYLVTIGISEYRQSGYNLTYAAKDARDIAGYFSGSRLFEETHVKTLTDREVTLENVRDLKTFVAQADVDDVVIISIAGHGILDNNLDYYLATYDMDFDNPAARGLAYDSLENILSATPSRKKTLIMDACHSGELDKAEVELAYEQETEFGQISFRAVGTRVVQKESMSLQSSFELSKMLFADMRSSNGSAVISSAGGAEYAMEGSEWRNGVFTFCLLSGLKEAKADLNRDKKIMLSELQQYLFEEVPRLTSGKQQPTSRVENLKNDFRIW